MIVFAAQCSCAVETGGWRGLDVRY